MPYPFDNFVFRVRLHQFRFTGASQVLPKFLPRFQPGLFDDADKLGPKVLGCTPISASVSRMAVVEGEKERDSDALRLVRIGVGEEDARSKPLTLTAEGKKLVAKAVRVLP